jgi:cysteinyl-tRNA synthetase
MALQLYNTYSNRKEEFVPVKAGKVGFYMCGPTVYDYIHLGNARAFIVFDMLRRFLRYSGYDVTYVQNITDIDDRIIERAIKDGVDTTKITAKYTQAFLEDLESLGTEPADVHPKATEHINEIVSFIQKLVEKGIAYSVDGDVFYDVSKFKDYGRLSGKKLDELQSGARVKVDERKRNPLDFVLWKSQKPGEPAWDSPWGAGRPGWHIECSAMAMKYLGESFDIHAGGIDLIFPHHENEIAQSEGLTNTRFVKYWLHNGFLEIDGSKMAKSLGNFRTVREVLKSYSGTVIRMFFFQKHYRSPIDFTIEGMQAAESAVNRLKTFYRNLSEKISGMKDAKAKLEPNPKNDNERVVYESLANYRQTFFAAISDDLNTPEALASLFDFVRECNKLLTKDSLSSGENSALLLAQKTFDEFNSFLGIVDLREVPMQSELVSVLMEILVEVRKELRAKKEWGMADNIRDALQSKGVILEDKSGKTSWRFE